MRMGGTRADGRDARACPPLARPSVAQSKTPGPHFAPFPPNPPTSPPPPPPPPEPPPPPIPRPRRPAPHPPPSMTDAPPNSVGLAVDPPVKEAAVEMHAGGDRQDGRGIGEEEELEGGRQGQDHRGQVRRRGRCGGGRAAQGRGRREG